MPLTLCVPRVQMLAGKEGCTCSLAHKLPMDGGLTLLPGWVRGQGSARGLEAIADWVGAEQSGRRAGPLRVRPALCDPVLLPGREPR